MADQPPFDPEQALRRLFATERNVKLGPGVVGKTSRAMLGLLGLWGVIILRIGPIWWVDAVQVGIGLVATGAVAWWTHTTQDFAAKNPAQAMLEGAQFLEYKKFEEEAKGGLRALPGKVELGDPSEPPAIKGL